MCKKSIPTSQKHTESTFKNPTGLTQFRKMITVYSNNHTNPINTIHDQNTVFDLLLL
jgi:hypothetical protein